MHLYETADVELLLRPRIEESVTLLDLSLIDPDVCELSELAILKLEREDDWLCVLLALKNNLLLVVIKVKSDVLDLCRIRKVAHDSIEKRLDTLVLVCGTHEYRAEFKSDRALPDRGPDKLWGDGILEHGLHKLIGAHGDSIKHLLPLGLCLSKELLRDLSLPDLSLIRTGIEIESLHVDKVDNSLEPVLKPDRDLHENRIEAELLDKLVLYPIWIGTRSIALVDECDAGDMVSLHLAVNRD